MMGEQLYGDCVICGVYLGESAYKCQSVIAITMPGGAVLCCVQHLFDGPTEKAPGYVEALDEITTAIAEQIKAND